MSATGTSLLELTLRHAADAVARAEVSPVELVDACLERIAAVNDELRAYISVYDDQAREVARAAETMARAGHRLGPLHGVPIALKDNIALAGLRTSAGSKVLADWVPEEDATVAARLKGAGAIVVGKTNMLAWSMDTVGPICRTVEDCALMFNAIAGQDPRDDASAQVPVVDYTGDLDRGVEGIRIGIVLGYFFHHLQPAVHEAVRAALVVLERLGASVVEVEIANIHGNISAQLTIESCEPSTYHQRWLRERPHDYGDDVRTLLELGELHHAPWGHVGRRSRFHLAVRSRGAQ